MDSSSGISISPWNILVGVWLKAVRNKKGLTTAQMGHQAGIQEPYLRSIESGIHALPSTAAPGLVSAYNVSFEAASMLVAAVRMLDERYKGADVKERPYNLSGISQQASNLRQIWPASGELMDWLDQQLTQLSSSRNPRDELAEIRKSIKEQIEASKKKGEVSFLIDSLNRLLQKSSRRQDDASAAAHSPAHDLSPFVADAVDQFLRRLALMPPELNREQLYAWERLNGKRYKAVWGVMSLSPEKILNDIDTIDWSFLVNQHRPILRLSIPGNAAMARELEVRFRQRILEKLVRPKARKEIDVRIKVSCFGKHEEAVNQLLWFDRTSRSIVDPSVSPPMSTMKKDERYTRFLNCWIYTLERDENDGSSVVGFMDNFSIRSPRFFCSPLTTSDLRRWLTVLENVHD